MGKLADLYAGREHKKKLFERAFDTVSALAWTWAQYICRFVGKNSIVCTAADETLDNTVGETHACSSFSITETALASPQELYDSSSTRMPHKRYKIASPDDVLSFLSEPLQKMKECFVVLTLDRTLALIEMRVIPAGTLAEHPLHPCNVFTDAITDRAAGVIVAHRNPDGVPAPRPEHYTIAERLKEVGAFINIELLDHLIITDSGFLSFQREGHL
jgi:DNA repair protein RadC